jgi:hypothetical protein
MAKLLKLEIVLFYTSNLPATLKCFKSPMMFIPTKFSMHSDTELFPSFYILLRLHILKPEGSIAYEVHSGITRPILMLYSIHVKVFLTGFLPPLWVITIKF